MAAPGPARPIPSRRTPPVGRASDRGLLHRQWYLTPSMPRRYSVVCDDDLGDAVEALSREYGLTEQEVLRQLVRRGLETTDDGGGNEEPSDVLGH